MVKSQLTNLETEIVDVEELSNILCSFILLFNTRSSTRLAETDKNDVSNKHLL